MNAKITTSVTLDFNIHLKQENKNMKTRPCNINLLSVKFLAHGTKVKNSCTSCQHSRSSTMPY